MQAVSATNTQSVTTALSYEKLTNRITTRIMAQKFLKQKELDDQVFQKEKIYAAYVDRQYNTIPQRSRQPSTFLLGAAVPNSIRRSESQVVKTINETEDASIARAKRDASVKEISERLQMRLKLLAGNEVEETVDEDEPTDTTASLRKRTKEEDTEDLEKAAPSETDIKKEKERISLRTSADLHIKSNKRSTYESMKKALLLNSNAAPGLIDVNKLENLKRNSSKVSQSSASSIKPIYESSKQSLTLSVSRNIAFSGIGRRSSKTSRKSSTSMDKKLKISTKWRKSILKDGSKERTRPIRNVSIIETKIDTETQTYLKMTDFVPKAGIQVL